MPFKSGRDNKSKKVRGIICNHCNTALHLVEDDASLKRALNYLSQSKL